MAAEALERYVLASTEAAYQGPGKQVPIGFMDSGGETCESRNANHWLYQKHP